MAILVRFAAPNGYDNDVLETAEQVSHTLSLSAPSTDMVTVTVRGPSYRAGDLDYADKVMTFAPGETEATFVAPV